MRGMAPLSRSMRDLIAYRGALWCRPGDYDCRRPGCEANPLDRMAVLVEAQGIHPLTCGFEAALRQRMRWE
jgi:hypothetical protein